MTRFLAPALAALLAGAWLGLHQRPSQAVDDVEYAAPPSRGALYLFVSPDGPDPSDALIRELDRHRRDRGIPVEVHLLEVDPSRAARARPWTLPARGTREDFSRYLRLEELLAPILDGRGVAPADPLGARLADSLGIASLPALVYISPDGTAHVRYGNAAGLDVFFDCRRSHP